MQDIRYNAFELAVTNVKIVKTVASFLTQYNPQSSGPYFIVVINNLKNIFSKVVILFLLLVFYSLSVISSSCSGATTQLFTLPLAIVFLSFFPSFFRGLLSLGAFFRLFFDLRGFTFFISLVILGIETHLPGLLSLGILLIQVGTFLNLGFSLSLINYTDYIISEYLISYVRVLQFYQMPEAIIKGMTLLTFSESIISVKLQQYGLEVL